MKKAIRIVFFLSVGFLPIVGLTKTICHCPTIKDLSQGFSFSRDAEICNAKASVFPAWSYNIRNEKVRLKISGGMHYNPIEAYTFLGAQYTRSSNIPIGEVSCFYHTEKGVIKVISGGLFSLSEVKGDKVMHMVIKPYGQIWKEIKDNKAYNCHSSNPQRCLFSLININAADK